MARQGAVAIAQLSVEQFARVEQLFFEAQQQTPENRDAFLAAQCPDDPIVRSEVRAMLSHAGAAGTMRPAGAIGGFDPAAWIGRSIGPYRITQQLGQGGMGIVYRAEQDRPVRRTVALKLIRPGMDSAEVIARFDSERQALAMMSHANVARVFDAGETDDGRHFFVMEYVPGEPITTYCNKQRLTTHERLELFMQVCDAVQHAHHKGIIHRDIKPSNVLVALENDRPVPKVIDFGIAKAVAQPIAGMTAITQMHQPIGTPQYMSPEQASLGAVDVDTRTDVYSLGVLLYELLAGAHPFEADALEKTAFDDVRRIIREVDPPVPSSRLSSVGATIHNIAQQRQSDAGELLKTLRGDLDWITMKALEKDRTRRYNSPADFAADVKRYLDYEPVTAGPPTLRYRVKKFVRRHRVGVLGSTLLGLAIVAGTVGTAWQARRATLERDRAQKRFNDLRVLAGDFLFKVDQALIQGGATEGRKQLLSTAVSYLDALNTEAGDDPTILSDLARGYRRAGMVQYFGGQANLADPAGALKLYEKSLETARRWKVLAPDDPEALDGVANGYYYISNAQQGLSQYQAAIDSARRAQDFWEQLLARNPGDDRSIRHLSNCWQQIASSETMLGRFDRALEASERFLKLREDYARRRPDDLPAQRGLAAAHDAMGSVLQRLDRPDQAIDHFSQTVAIIQKMSDAAPKNLFLKRDLAFSLDAIARVQIQSKKFDAAIENIVKSLALRRALADADSTNRTAQEDLGISYRTYANALRKSGRNAEALTAMQQSLAIRQQLVESHPDDMNYRRNLADAYSVVCDIHAALGDSDAAGQAGQKAIDILNDLFARDIAIDLDIENQSKNYQRLGDVLLEADRKDPAVEQYQLAIDVLKKSENPANPRLRATLAFAHARMGDALQSLDRTPEARKHWQTAIEIGSSNAAGFDALAEVTKRLTDSDPAKK